MDALLLVDLQNDFMPGGALPVAGGDEVIPIANRLARHFDLVVATKDWHPRDHGSFVTTSPGMSVGDRTTLGGLEQVVWPEHCVQGTHGAAFHDALDDRAIDHVVTKGTDPDIDSYSGFFDNGHRRATGLEALLREHHVDRVYLMGLATDYCVKFTALDARRHGFDVTLIMDGCRGVELSPGDVDRAVAEMEEAGVKLVTSEALLAP